MALTTEQKAAWDAQVARADEAYMTGAEDSTDVQADLDARVALSQDTFTEVTNDELGETLDTVNGSQDPEQLVDVIDEHPTEMATLVKDAADAGDLFEVGGPTDDWVGDSADLSAGVDGLFLAERSKQTGQKFF